MRLASWVVGDRSTWGAVCADGSLIAYNDADTQAVDIKALLTPRGLADIAARIATKTPVDRVSEVRLLSPIPRPGKILCVGVNYPDRNAEYKDGSETPKYPSLFVRFPGSLIGHNEPLIRPKVSEQFDYEGEIVIVIGKGGRHIAAEDARAAIAGLTLMNEGSVRDWIRHGKFNVTQGKNFDSSGAIGPWMVTLDEAGPLDALELVTRVNGEERQRGNTGTLAFPFAHIVEYVSTFTTLEPGDLIATGTPTGAGARFSPPKWLKPGDVVEVECPDIGTLRNVVEDERA